MPKTYNNLWQHVVCWDNLHAAYRQASKKKRYSDAHLAFRDSLEENIFNIQNRLLWGTWKPGPYREFIVYEPKKRMIMAPPFPDRVVHHALVNVVEPLFEKKFIHHSFACRKGKGSHNAALQVQQYLRRAKAIWGDNVYFLKADISKYFPSVQPVALKWAIARTLRDKQVLDLCEMIIDHGARCGVGMPVGALTSQLWSNIYPDRMDHMIKDDMGVKFYVRYVDDWIIVGPSRAWLWDILDRTMPMLDSLELTLNSKTDVQPASHGVDFCGYRIWATHMLPRKRNVQRAKRKFRAMAARYSPGNIDFDRIRPVVASFAGYMKHCAGFRTAQSTLNYMTIGG